MTISTLKTTDVQHPDLPTLLIVLSAIGFGTVPFFARNLTEAGMTPAAVAFYRYAFSAVAFLPFLRLGKHSWSVSMWGMLSGLIVGLGWIGYVNALQTLPVSTAGVIYMTYPVFTVLIGWIFFGERPGRRAFLAVILICTAAILASSPTLAGAGDLSAVLLAFLAPLGFGAGINILARKLVGVPPLSRIACKSLGSVVGLLPLILVLPAQQVLPQSTPGWGLIAGIALVTALLPQLLFNIYVPVIGATKTAMASSMELPTMFVVGWIAFGERLTFIQLLAGLLVVLAILITPRAGSRTIPQKATARSDA